MVHMGPILHRESEALLKRESHKDNERTMFSSSHYWKLFTGGEALATNTGTIMLLQSHRNQKLQQSYE